MLTHKDSEGEELTLCAAKGQLQGKCSVKHDESCPTSSFVSGFANEGDAVLLRFNLEHGGSYTLHVLYRSPFGNKVNDLLVNGQLHRKDFAKADSWMNAEVGNVMLPSGANEIRFVKNWGWMDVSAFQLKRQVAAASSALPDAAPCVAVLDVCGGSGSSGALVAQLQAEVGRLGGGTSVATTAPGFHGGGYVTGLTQPGSYVAVDFNAPGPDPELYSIWLRYRAPCGDKVNRLCVDGEPLGAVSMAGCTAWQQMEAGRCVLQPGRAEIRLQHDWGWVDVDSFLLYRCTPRPPPRDWEPARALSPPARALLRYLQASAGTRVVSGQQVGSSSGGEFERIRAVTGRTPALKGLDLLNYTSAVNWHDGTPEQAIDWAQRGGIVSLCWHWFSPLGKTGAKSFYTKDTSYDVAAAVTEGTVEHAAAIKDIDMIAVQLKKLQAANVPVLWRPLHEAEGKWFWWGAKGWAPCKALYCLLFNRLSHFHKLDNLLWVWTAGGSKASEDWYPGDSVVDIIGADVYSSEGDHSCAAATYHALTQLSPEGRLLALCECGGLPDPKSMALTHWSWVCCWSGYFATDGKWNGDAELCTFYDDPKVVTLESLGRWWEEC